MKRGTKCIAQTINLSQPKTCVRPRQVQKLVSGDVMEPCPTPGQGRTPYWTPKPVAIRICTRKELERTCPPKLCDCPQKAPPETMRQKIGRWLKFLLKGAIAAGLVYWTSAEGLWGDSKETEQLYFRILATIAPVLPEVPDLDNVRLPHMENWKHLLYDGYNRMVLAVMGLLVGVPIMIQEKVFGTLFPCIEEPEPVSKGKDKKEAKKDAKKNEKKKDEKKKDENK